MATCSGPGRSGDRARRSLVLLLQKFSELLLESRAIVQQLEVVPNGESSADAADRIAYGILVAGLEEETARMVVPARRGHPELAWGNVVGTLVILLGFNLGLIALVRPLNIDPLVLRLHVPYLIGVALLVVLALFLARKLGRRSGAVLVALYLLYFALNLRHMWG